MHVHLTSRAFLSLCLHATGQQVVMNACLTLSFVMLPLVIRVVVDVFFGFPFTT